MNSRDSSLILRISVLFAFAVCCHSVSLAAEDRPFLSPLAAQQDNSAAFVIYQNIPLDAKECGIIGTLQILQDKRVTPEYRQTWGNSAYPMIALGPDNGFVKSIEHHPLNNGRIRLLGQNGHVIAEDSFTEPLAKIATAYLYGSNFPTYLVTVDYGTGIGSYSGPATTLIEVRSGRLIDIPIFLVSSLKNAWRIVPDARGAGKEIETVSCHPNFKNPNWSKTEEFMVDYSTYSFVRGTWHEKSNEKIGFWESDDGWPPSSSFP